jgi:hypothetical protein
VKYNAFACDFLFPFSSNSPTAQTKRLTYAYFIPEDVVRAKDVLFGSHIRKISFRGIMPQKPADFGAGIGISSLNVESNNFRMAQPILVIHSSNDAAPRNKLGY